MAEGTASQVQLVNNTERVLHITLEGGEIVSVPPKEQGSQTVTFNDADERARFERALQTETVKRWLDDKELVVQGLGAVATPQPVQPQTTHGGEATSGGRRPKSSDKE